MAEIRVEADIQAPVEAIFDAIVDLRGYSRWLADSKGYPGTTEISPGPMAVGTTYVESGPGGVRHGMVTELEPPTRVSFRQPMTMKPRLLGTIGIDVTYTLTPAGESVHLLRVTRLKIPWTLKLAQPLVVREIRTENERTVGALKAFTES